MPSRFVSWMIALLGVIVFCVALLPGSSVATNAAPLLNVTATGEIPTPTPTTQPSPTPIPTLIVTPSPTPVVTPSPTPVVTPGTGPSPTPSPTAPPGNPVPTPDEKFVDVAITKRASVITARVGDQVTFTLDVTNLGNIPAENVTVNDTLIDQFDLVGVTTSRGTVATNGRSITVSVGTVQPGELITIQIITTINTTAQIGTLRNVAVITTTTLGDPPGNNRSEVPVEVVALVPTTVSTADAIAPTPAPTAAPPTRLPVTGGLADSYSVVLILVAALLIGAGLVFGRRSKL